MNRSSDAVTRMYLALVIAVAVICVAAIAIPVPAALVVFDKLLPVLMLVLGYYFGQSGSVR